jgi:hypothetical protein
MNKLLIETFGVIETFERLADALEFYPHGLKGLITDYLVHYLSGPPTLYDSDSRDEAFFDRVMQMYHDSYLSPEFRFNAPQVSNPSQQEILLLLCLGVGATVRRIVEHYEKELRSSVVDVHSIKWGHNYMLLERSN